MKRKYSRKSKPSTKKEIQPAFKESEVVRKERLKTQRKMAPMKHKSKKDYKRFKFSEDSIFD